MNNLILDEFDEKKSDLNNLNFLYLVWIENEKSSRQVKSTTSVRNLILFKKHLKEISDSLYFFYSDYINSRIRLYYLIQKYSKKWLTYFINRKDPINDTDLELNDIDVNKYYINYIDYKEHKRYLFSEKDFCKIVNTCLQNSYEFDIDPSPMTIKNPYTNSEFSKSELRSLHNKVRDMPILWLMFVDSDYDIIKFKCKYYSHLLELCIPNYVEKLGDEDIIDYLLDIFRELNITDYCGKCLLSKEILKDRKVKKSIIGWIRYLKLNIPFHHICINNLNLIYQKISCICSEFDCNHKIRLDFIKGIDFNRSLFSPGYKGRTDKSDYWEKKKIIERKKRVLNKLR